MTEETMKMAAIWDELRSTFTFGPRGRCSVPREHKNTASPVLLRTVMQQFLG